MMSAADGFAGERRADWRPTQIQLRYALGELVLFRRRFQALACDAHFTELSSDLAATEAALPALNGEAGALMIRSHPVPDCPSVIKRRERYLRYAPSCYRRFFIDLTRGAFSDYLAAFSSKSRQTLQRKLRKFREAGGGELDWRTFRAAAEVDEFVRLAREISKRTYQERLFDAGLPGDEAYRAALRAAAERDELRAYTLFLEKRPVAYLCCPAQNGVLLYQYLGYDPQYAALSPGTVLQLLVLEALFEEWRFRLFDFTEGEGAHKAFFANGSTLCADL